jgi:hypothetical protein
LPQKGHRLRRPERLALSARIQLLSVKALLLPKDRMGAMEDPRLASLGRRRLLTPRWAMAEQVQLSPQEVRILSLTETPLPLQLMLWILQPRHERDRRPLCAMPRPARCFPGAAAVGKNPATWPHPQAVLGRRERRLRLEELDRRQCRPRSSRLRRSRPYWSRGLAGRASGWPDDAIYWKGKEQ